MTSPADGDPSNNAMAAVNRTVIAPLPLPYTEGFGSYADGSVPTGWSADMGLYDFKARANHGATADMGFAANLYSGNSTSFAIMPKIGPFLSGTSTFSFDYRIVDYTGYANPGGTATVLTTTDSIYLEYSLDCGVTFTKVPGSVITSTTHTTSNLFVNKSITLPAAVAGQEVVFRWIGKWAGSGTSDYWVDIDNINITSCPSISAPNNTTPPASLTICSGNTTTLTASALGSGTLTWYNVPSGGTPLGTGSTFTTPVLTTTTTYYVAEEVGSCSSPRTAITVNVVPTPAAPTVVSYMPNDTVCAGTIVTITMSGTGTIKWYDSPTGGTPFFTGAVISGPAIETDSAYVTADNGTCESSPRTKVKIVVNPLPNVTYTVPASQDTVCTTDAPFTLTGGSPSGGTYSGGSYITGGNTFNPALAGTGSKMVIYTYTDANGCTNKDTAYIVVKICTEVQTAMASNIYYLGQSYPNPTTNTANIDIYVPKTERVVITLMNVEGKVIRTLFEDNLTGHRTLQIDTSDLPAGMYLYRMQAGNYTDLKRMSVVK
ncbi:MAG: T9SS type A sorting domain-containing protein, partial [Bacteroidia bacterium]|nr:T9SS type A sorting domain-containing protein [Bacteroidia bacterium]